MTSSPICGKNIAAKSDAADPVTRVQFQLLSDKCQDIVNSFLYQDIGYTYFLSQ